MSRIGVIGAGAWGTAIAHTMAANDHKVLLWTRDEVVAEQINNQHQNPKYLGAIELNPNVRATFNPANAIIDADFLFLVTPAQTTANSARMLLNHGVKQGTAIVCCAKGLDQNSGKRVSETVSETLPSNPVLVLSGPSFAHDVASGLPTAVTLACDDLQTALAACKTLSSNTLRLYASDDLRGVELGGALKNVMAIAAGIVKGVGLGESAKAALIARGFVEMERLAEAYGARPQTLKGLSGLGDLVLTCGTEQSRNYSYGLSLASSAGCQSKKLAEGAYTANSAKRLAEQLNVDAPIITAVAKVLAGDQTIAEAVESLTSRPVKAELD
ncbi:MAG: NAD(P)H-dependent glycerol-3-phosphate dehydrogenase [Pseudomonadota bacterium]